MQKTVVIAKQNMSKKYSGATRSVYEQIRFFQEKNWIIYVVADEGTASDLNEYDAHFIKTFKYPWQKKVKRREQYSSQVDKFVKKIQPDLTISHGDFKNADIFVTHNCVHLAHERIQNKALPPSNEMFQTHTPIFEKSEFKTLIANSYIVKDDLSKRFDISKDKIEVVYPSLFEDEFKRSSQEKIINFKKEIGMNPNDSLVGLITSGAFQKRNLKEFFDAIDLLPAKLANKAFFIFVGKDKIYKQAQESLDRNRYKDRIKHFPIISDIATAYSALDLFVLPAKIEEFGRVVAEAMACGAPVITTSWVGASEVLDGRSRDFIYEGEDPKKLALLIEEVISDDSLKEELSKINQDAVKKIFESETYKKFEKIFE